MSEDTRAPSSAGGAGAPGDHCANCGEPLTGPFCAACGQENRNLARIPLSRILHDWLGDTFTFDSRFLRTLGPLVRRPGLLTREYLAGRRARYVPPLRLFVFLSLVMFLALALTGAKLAWRVDKEGEEVVAFDPRTSPEVEPAAASPGEAEEPAAAQQDGGEGDQDEGDDLALLDDPEEINRRLLDRAPQVMVVLVPVVAFFLWLLHRRRAPLFVPHLIFSLHLHSFVFLVVLLICLVDLPFPRENRFGIILLILAAPPYLYLAQRRVYGGGRLANLAKTAGLLLAHGVAWVLLMLALLMAVVLLA